MPQPTPVGIDIGNSGASKTVDWHSGPVQQLTLTGNCTLTFSNPLLFALYKLILVQDNVGTRLVTWPGTVKWPGGVAPTLTITVGKIDIVEFLYDGTNYHGRLVGWIAL